MQEVFNKVWNHLKAQNAQSIDLDADPDEEGWKPCMYHNPQGLKCAVGCLITDEAYAKWGDHIEGLGSLNSEVLRALSESGVDVDADNSSLRVLLRMIQFKVHDPVCNKTWKEMRPKMVALAREYNLEVPNDD
jgi:hypothetical protein